MILLLLQQFLLFLYLTVKVSCYDHILLAPIVDCKVSGQRCSQPQECCTGYCKTGSDGRFCVSKGLKGFAIFGCQNLNDPCVQHFECCLGYCLENTCQLRPGCKWISEPCKSDIECCHGLCRDEDESGLQCVPLLREQIVVQ